MSDKEIDEIIDELIAEAEKQSVMYWETRQRLGQMPPIAVGTKVQYQTISTNTLRTGVVVEAPGPSTKYNGRPAERYEIRLVEDVDHWGDIRPETTIFADRADLKEVL